MRRSTLFLAHLFGCACGAATGTGSASVSPSAAVAKETKMFRSRYAPLLLVVVAALVACGSPASSGSASPGTTPAATTADVLAVANQVWFGPNGGPCSTSTMAQCPVTARLATRIQSIEKPKPVGPGPIAYWCRCSKGSTVTMTADVTATGGIAHLTFDNASKVDFIMVQQAGKLLVDDTKCSGGAASTSIYADQLAGCA